MKRCAPLFIVLTLAGCGQSDPPAPLATPPPVAEAPGVTVAALDEFGPFDGRVNGIAFWIHPSVPFNSMALLATDTGLLALNIEDGKEIARVEGFKAGALQVLYDDVNGVVDPDGFRSRGVAVVRDEDARTIRFFDIHNAARDLSEIGEGFAVGEMEAFCAGPQFNGPLRLVVFSAGKMLTYDLGIGKDSVGVVPTALEDQQVRDRPAPARACAIDKRGGEMLVLYDTGEIARFVEHTRRRMEAFTPTRLANPVGLDLALNGSALDGDESDCCGQVGVLDADAATVRLYDFDDGAALGNVRIAVSFEDDGVETATAFGLGQGNFGGPFRDGVLALAMNDGKPVLRLAPLNRALEALAVGFGETHNPRTLTPNPLERQCADLEADGERFAACAPYREAGPSAGLARELAPPPAVDGAVNDAAPASDE